ncbi:hypothetical protein SLS59_006499 [Nothophoma quercina]|uniref:Uncharacterized protein n=1 Tax=Nothophoma quercina TaxID=749835 RepID=A0ABR3R3Q7_9PLEO
MPLSTDGPKLYLRASSLDFKLNGPIKIGNVIERMTFPEDSKVRLDPLPKIVGGAALAEGRVESERHAALHAGLAAKLSNVFVGQAEAKKNSSLRTVYAFDKISTLMLERFPDDDDVEAFRSNNEKFKKAVDAGPVGVVGDVILAYRLHIVKSKWFSSSLIAKSHDPGDAGFMNKEDKVDKFEGETKEVSLNDVNSFAKKQYYPDPSYVEFEDDEEEWTLAVLEEEDEEEEDEEEEDEEEEDEEEEED